MRKRTVFAAFLLGGALLAVQAQELLPGKALGGRIIPPFGVSAGGGAGIEAGILGFETKADTKVDDFSGYALDFPIYGFLDATYFLFETGPVFGFSDWGSYYRPGIEKPIGWDFSLFAKFPVILNRQFQIYPLLGLRYRLGLKDSISYDDYGPDEIPKNYIDSLWLLAGVGFDANLTRRVYIRTELLYSDRMGSGYGTFLNSEGVFSKIYEVGPEARVAVGVHLGKLKNITPVTADKGLATIRDAFSSPAADIVAEFPLIEFEPNSHKVKDAAAAEKILSDVAEAWKKNPADYSIVIDGNANPVLHSEIERRTLYELSRGRAFAIADVLANRYGVPAGSLAVFISSGINAGSNGDVNRSVDIKIVRSRIRGVYSLESGAFEPGAE